MVYDGVLNQGGKQFIVARSVLKPDRGVLRQGDSTNADQGLMKLRASFLAKRVIDRQCQAFQFAEGMS